MMLMMRSEDSSKTTQKSSIRRIFSDVELSHLNFFPGLGTGFNFQTTYDATIKTTRDETVV